MPVPGNDPAQRLLAIEEHVGHLEHQLDGLSASMADLGARLESLARTVRSLGARLGRLETPSTDEPAADSDEQ